MLKKNRNKKLLYLVNDANFFISHRLQLALEAKKDGYDIHIASPFSESVKLFYDKGFSYHKIIMNRKGVYLIKELISFYSVMKLISEIKPDILHNITIKPVIYGSISAKITKVPAVINAITGLGYVYIAKGVKGNILRWIVNVAYRFAFNGIYTKIIFQNPDDKLYFVNSKMVKESDCVLIKGSGVDLSIYVQKEIDNNIPIVMLPSRILWDKGVGEFVEAARILKEQGVEARFVLVGNIDNGNPSAISVEKVESWVDKNIIEWWGFHDNMEDVLVQADIVCLPSYREGCPKVLLEASACGKSIVTTDVPGCRDVVIDGENGILVQSKSSNELSVALKILINNKDKRRCMGNASRKLAEQEYSIEFVVGKTMELYNSLE